MKKQLIISTLFVLSFVKVNAQNDIYIISEKYDGIVVNAPTFDSVYVTNPAGVTTKYKVPSYVTNPGEHNSQFNIILNGITNLGYKIITPVEKEGVSNSTLPQPYCAIRTMYLSKP
jgi:hypothetical protein